MGQFGKFLTQVFTRWEPIVTGVAATFLLWVIAYLYEQKYGDPLPWYWYGYVAFLFVFIACYYTWRAQQEIVSARQLDLLNRERAINKLHEALSIQIDDDINELVISLKSPLSPPERFAHSQRRTHHLWCALEKAGPEDKPLLIKRLDKALVQQIDLLALTEQRPSTNYQERYYTIIQELEKLRNLAKTLET